MIGVIAILIEKIVKYTISLFRNWQYSRNKFTISGTWISYYDYSETVDIQAIELYYIKQNEDKITMREQHYNSSHSSVKKFKGIGIVRSSNISMIYYACDRNSPQTGNISLKINRDLGSLAYLEGSFIESQNMNKDFIGNNYRLNFIKVNWLIKIRLKLGIKVFKNYNGLRKYLKKLNFKCEGLENGAYM